MCISWFPLAFFPLQYTNLTCIIRDTLVMCITLLYMPKDHQKLTYAYLLFNKMKNKCTKNPYNKTHVTKTACKTEKGKRQWQITKEVIYIHNKNIWSSNSISRNYTKGIIKADKDECLKKFTLALFVIVKNVSLNFF